MDSKHLINFVPAVSSRSDDADNGQHPVNSFPALLDGTEVRSFYEELVQTDFNKEEITSNKQEDKSIATKLSGRKNNKAQKRKKDQREVTTESEERKTYKSSSAVQQTLLHLSQDGDIQGIKKLLEENTVNLNCQDQYGWTAMMCAAVGKHTQVVELLIAKGASKYVQNNKGDTVLDMCPDIFTEIEYRKVQSRKRKRAERVSKNFYCEVCGREFSEVSIEKHNASTVHLFNLGLQPKSDKFLISECNIGYKLMQKAGWDGESGLGSSGQGQKYPVKTVLKQDRKCIGMGNSKKKPKVTHFGPNDESAVKSGQKSKRVESARTVSKRELKRKREKEKKWERDLRVYMNTD